MDLGMTLEQVGVNMICQSLPDEVGKDLRAGLRALHSDKEKYAFSIKEIVKVYNDVISINGMADESASIHSTLCLRTGVKPPAGRGQCGATGRGCNPPCQANPLYQQNPPYQLSPQFLISPQFQSSPQVQSNPQYQSNLPYQSQSNPPFQVQSNPPFQSYPLFQPNLPGRGRGRARGKAKSRQETCYLCVEPDQPRAIGHTPATCQKFLDRKELRKRLGALGRCMACAGIVHAGNCPPEVECFHHNKARHLYWTCDRGCKPGHPGKQEPSSR